MIKKEALEKFANKYISYFENEFEPTGELYYHFCVCLVEYYY